jgi:GNAT superfamily N-acetyltransferase
MSPHLPPLIEPLRDDMLGTAGALLAERHQRDRRAAPALPAAPVDPDVAAAAVEAALTRPRASAAAALRGGRLSGYMAGDVLIDPLWGRAAWVRLAGWALAPGESAELLRDLYAALAAEWVRRGVFDHYAIVPAADAAALAAWHSLGFGIEQVHAIADLDDRLAEPAPVAGLTLRRASPADAGQLAELSDLIWRHQTQSPVWAPMLPEMAAGRAASYASMAEDDEAIVWLALDGERALGFQAYFPAEPAPESLLTPAACVELSVAGTRPEARGRGVGLALTRHGLAAARAAGARHCLSDWRSANLLVSRFWPRQGFRPVAYRLARRVDPRIAWANGGDM